MPLHAAVLNNASTLLRRAVCSQPGSAGRHPRATRQVATVACGPPTRAARIRLHRATAPIQAAGMTITTSPPAARSPPHSPRRERTLCMPSESTASSATERQDMIRALLWHQVSLCDDVNHEDTKDTKKGEEKQNILPPFLTFSFVSSCLRGSNLPTIVDDWRRRNSRLMLAEVLETPCRSSFAFAHADRSPCNCGWTFLKLVPDGLDHLLRQIFRQPLLRAMICFARHRRSRPPCRGRGSSGRGCAAGPCSPRVADRS